MAQYPKTTLTNSGLDLIGESIADGKALIFTKAVLGDGQLSTGQDIKILTGLINPLLTMKLTSGDKKLGQAKLRFTVSNSGLDTGFFAREVGVFAKVGEDGAEQLYAYTNGGNYVDYVPDKNNPIDDQIMDFYVITGNAETVQILVNSAAYATIEDLNDHNTSDSAHENLFAEKLNKSGDTATGLLQLAQTLITNLSTNIPADDNSGKLVPSAWVQNLLAALATNTAVTWDGDNFSCPALDIHGLMAQNGYISCGKLFGGFIIQWGYEYNNNTIIFPIPFSILLNISGTHFGNLNTGAVSILTYNSVSFTVDWTTKEGSDNNTGWWIALGK